MPTSLRLLQNIGVGALFLVLPVAKAGPLFETVAAFERGPENPGAGDLLLHTDGNFYGVSSATVYKVTALGELDMITNFTGDGFGATGTGPLGLASDGVGFFWGTTYAGGTNGAEEGYGTVFKIDPAVGQIITVAAFTGVAARGGRPSSVLASDGAGYLWGTTAPGGGGGTVFKIDIRTGVLTTVVEFTGTSGNARGRSPYARLVNDGNGFMWGTTAEGGAGNLGTIFKVNVTTGAFATLAEFSGATGTARGSYPRAGLISDGAGRFWGTTSGVSSTGFVANGTVFKFEIVTGVLTSVVSFTGKLGAARGRNPNAALVGDGGGLLWGTTYAGGTGDSGTVFSVNEVSGELTTVVDFTTVPGDGMGSFPSAGLIRDSSGLLWGTTSNGGGPGEMGTIFKVNPVTKMMTTVTGFPSATAKGVRPMAGLAGDGSDWLWGTAASGSVDGGNRGTVFKVNTRTGSLRKVVEFTGEFGPVKGENPLSTLLFDGLDSFWGTTREGGVSRLGTVFRVARNTGLLTTVVEFNGDPGPTKGHAPFAGLVPDGGGFYWGTTKNGGASNNGTVFRIDAATGVLTTVVEFTGTVGPTKGSEPVGRLFNGGSGWLWGTTSSGGSQNQGTVFKISPITGALSTVVEFTGLTGAKRGALADGELIGDGAGFLWGTTAQGGTGNHGTVFKLDRVSGAFATVAEFTGTSGSVKGRIPQAGLARDSTGTLWGTTSGGGAGDFGTIFRVSASGVFSNVFDFTGPDGPIRGNLPVFGSLFSHSDGHLYGTSAGPGNGQVYRLRFGPVPTTTPPTPIGSTSARLRGLLNPNGYVTVVTFEYGTDPALAGSSIIGAGTTENGSTPIDVSALITGLSPTTLYYFRLRGLNAENPNLQEGRILSFTTAPLGFTGWAGDFGLSDNTAAANADPDSDRLPNAVEYVLGSDPTTGTQTEPLAVTINSGDAVFTFLRSDNSETADLTIEVETGPDLASWPSRYVVGADTASSSPGVSVSENGGEADTVAVSVTPGLNTKLFARLRVTVAP